MASQEGIDRHQQPNAVARQWHKGGNQWGVPKENTPAITDIGCKDAKGDKVNRTEAAAMTEVTLEFLARQFERVLSEIAGMRDDQRVQTAMIMRLDGSHTTLLTEMHAVHAQIARMNDRIRKLEDAQ
jgi:hypothetical protein